MSDNVTIAFTTEFTSYWLVGLGLALILTLAGTALKSAFMLLFAIPSWLAAYFTSPLINTWYSITIGLMCLYCIVAAFFSYKGKINKYG